MLPVILLVLGILFIALGLFDRYTGGHQIVTWGFFMLGFLHLFAALFLFMGGVAPYGAVLNTTTTTNYSPDYSEYMNDSVTCVNCTEGCFDCTGELNCALLLDETNCTACDQCYWFEGTCYEEQGAECSLSETCEDCPECDSNPTNETAFCCEHDFNTTITGAVTTVTVHEYNTYGEEIVRALFFGDFTFVFLISLLVFLAYLVQHARKALGERDD